MKRKVSVGVAALLLAAGAGVGLAWGAQAKSVTMKATLTANQQVPPQHVKTPNASARFTGTLLRYERGTGAHLRGRGSLTWALTYKNLSSRAKQAEVVIPSPSGPGSILLCRPCKPSSHGVVKPLPIARTSALLTRTSYVVIYTKKNPKGEIRGRIVKSG